jgi:hypothetical protein
MLDALARSTFDLFSIVKRIVGGFRDHGERPHRLDLVSDAATKRRSRRNIQEGRVAPNASLTLGPALFSLTCPSEHLPKALPGFPYWSLCGFESAARPAQKHKM